MLRLPAIAAALTFGVVQVADPGSGALADLGWAVLSAVLTAVLGWLSSRNRKG